MSQIADNSGDNARALESNQANSSNTSNQLSDDPLFVSNSENFSSSLVTQPLTGVDNYVTWKRSMEMVLGIKSKLVFVQGKIPKPSDPYKLSRWEKCNKVVLSWIVASVSKEIASGIIHCQDCAQAWSILQMRFAGSSNGTKLQQLHKEIVTLTQGDLDVTAYHGKLLQLWAEEEALDEYELCCLGAECKSTIAMEAKRQNFKLHQFLTGLHERHSTVRTQISSTKPKPSLDEAYHMVLEDEMTKGVTKSITPEISAMYVSQQQGNQQNQYQQKRSHNNSNSGNKNKRNLFCTHCQMTGHTKEVCYKIVGYPPGHKFYNRNGNNNSRTNRNTVNNVVATESLDNCPRDTGNNAEDVCSQSIASLKINQE